MKTVLKKHFLKRLLLSSSASLEGAILKKYFLLSFFIFSFFFSFGQKEKKFILISRDNNSNINKYLSLYDSSFTYKEVYRLSWDSLDYYLSRCSGVVIGGGNDVNPAIYGMEEKKNLCGDFDMRRDTLEVKMIKYGIKNKIPTLGICRGHQILNVAMGGTLILDIPTQVKTEVKHRNYIKYAHKAILKKGTYMQKVVGLESFNVNSLHHQAVDKISEYFEPFAFSEDGIMEGIEIKESYKHPFAVGVQWHPELLVQDDFSKALANYYLNKCKAK